MSNFFVKTVFTHPNGVNDIRRFKLQPDTVSPFSDLAAFLQMTYGLPKFLVVKYEDDDGDLCSVSSDMELMEAFRLAEQSKRILKILVAAAPQESKSETQTTIAETQPIAQEPVQQHQDIVVASAAPVVPVEQPVLPVEIPAIADLDIKEIPVAYPVIQDNKTIAGLPVDEQDAKAALPALPTHSGVRCDGCGANPIVGIRFKCVACPNFDFCERCESSVSHPVEHNFLKIRLPRGRHVQSCEGGRGWRNWWAQSQQGNTQQGNNSWGRWASELAQRRSLASQPCPENNTKCPENNSKWWARNGWRHRRDQPCPEINMPAAAFVADVSLPDGSNVQAGQVVDKTWCLKNTGSVQWPEGSHIAFVRGDLAPARQLPTVVLAKPGEEVQITVPLAVPTAPGRYKGMYHLRDGEDNRFGPRFWVDLNVIAAPQEAVDDKKVTPVVTANEKKVTVVVTPQVPSVQPAVEVQQPVNQSPQLPKGLLKRYETELSQLRNMGFTDDSLSLYLLSNNRGNVQRVIDYLVQTRSP